MDNMFVIQSNPQGQDAVSPRDQPYRDSQAATHRHNSPILTTAQKSSEETIPSQITMTDKKFEYLGNQVSPESEFKVKIPLFQGIQSQNDDQ